MLSICISSFTILFLGVMIPPHTCILPRLRYTSKTGGCWALASVVLFVFSFPGCKAVMLMILWPKSPLTSVMQAVNGKTFCRVEHGSEVIDWLPVMDFQCTNLPALCQERDVRVDRPWKNCINDYLPVAYMVNQRFAQFLGPISALWFPGSSSKKTPRDFWPNFELKLAVERWPAILSWKRSWCKENFC